jgi:hypothetical protein
VASQKLLRPPHKNTENPSEKMDPNKNDTVETASGVFGRVP